MHFDECSQLAESICTALTAEWMCIASVDEECGGRSSASYNALSKDAGTLANALHNDPRLFGPLDCDAGHGRTHEIRESFRRRVEIQIERLTTQMHEVGRKLMKQWIGRKAWPVLASRIGALLPENAKIHLATHNGEDDPVDVFLAGEFKEWQESQSRRNFELQYIVSLIKLPEPNTWLFAGVYETDGHQPDPKSGRYIYRTRVCRQTEDLVGRLVILFVRPGKQPYLSGKRFSEDLVVSDVRPTALTRPELDEMRRAVTIPKLDREAAACLRVLIEHVHTHNQGALSPITYEELARALQRTTHRGNPWARGLGRVLSRMTRELANVSDEWGVAVPYINAIVVQKTGADRGLPDVGIAEFWPGYERLSREERRDKLALELRRVQQFGSRWNDVLRKLQLPVAIPEPRAPRGMSGGESPEHLALKHYVRDNPSLVGAVEVSEATTEYALPSGDEIDVFFRCKTESIAVEVKSSLSTHVKGDHERGIYQAIKYLAVLKAMSQDGRRKTPPRARALLVLEKTLSPDERELAKRLKVDVVENVLPPRQYLEAAQRSGLQRRLPVNGE